MGVVVSEELDDLKALDPSLLYVFVAGPGLGEGIAVALSGGGWLLVDSCRTPGPPGSDELPLLSILKRWRRADPDPVKWLILTHPHQDHVDGFATLIDGATPDHIGLAGCDAQGPSVYEELRAWAEGSVQAQPEHNIPQLLSAAKAMRRWEDEHGRALLPLHDGVDLSLGGRVSAKVRAPDPTLARPLLKKGWPALQAVANELSLVIELTYGDARVVLGGDLPHKKPGGKVNVKTGWKHVMNRHFSLSRHTGLKVPHHGSQEALESRLLRGGGHPSLAREWWATPYSRSGLPRAADREGLHTLLNAHPCVRLTALPVGKTLQADRLPPAQRTRAEVRAEVEALKPEAASSFLAKAVPITPIRGLTPLDPVWCSAFDAAGDPVGAWRGRVALEVVP